MGYLRGAKRPCRTAGPRRLSKKFSRGGIYQTPSPAKECRGFPWRRRGELRSPDSFRRSPHQTGDHRSPLQQDTDNLCHCEPSRKMAWRPSAARKGAIAGQADGGGDRNGHPSGSVPSPAPLQGEPLTQAIAHTTGMAHSEIVMLRRGCIRALRKVRWWLCTLYRLFLSLRSPEEAVAISRYHVPPGTAGFRGGGVDSSQKTSSPAGWQGCKGLGIRLPG